MFRPRGNTEGGWPAGLPLCALVLLSVVATTRGQEVTCLTTETEINFEDATLVYNNLGGFGPNSGDPEQIRYGGIGTKNGERIDLVVTASAGYAAANANNNGLNGKFGQINTLVGTESVFTFTFVNFDAGDAVTTIGDFYFSAFDLDKSKKTTEFWCFDDEDGATLEYEDSDAMVVINQGVACDGGAGASTLFTANAMGFGCDNPDDPSNLRVIECPDDACSNYCDDSRGRYDDYFPIDQKQRSVTVAYQGDRESFHFTATVVGSGSGGRNLVFAGTSTLVEAGAAIRRHFNSTVPRSDCRKKERKKRSWDLTER